MELAYKADFEAARKRWRAFWVGDPLDRPPVRIEIQKPGVEPVEKPPYTSGKDGHFGPVIDQLLAWADTHLFLGEAIPFYYLEFGPDHFSTFLGADLHYNTASGDTTWAVPFVEDYESTDIRFRPESLWWRRTVDFIHAIRERCDGKLLIAAPTFVASLDALAAIRGVERLLFDLVEAPEQVHAALEAVTRAYEAIAEAIRRELDVATWGSINRHGMYCDGLINVPQCDFSAMIGPEMFRAFEAPCLARECAILDHAEYHLDGPDAIRHLEALCEIDGIDIIQWVPGTGNEGRDWTWLYERIDALGKGQILGGGRERIKQRWRAFRSRRLFFTTGAESPDDAERFLDELSGVVESASPHPDVGEGEGGRESGLIRRHSAAGPPPP